jgi:cell division protein FtsI (penicillin-binding protein 3)
MMDKVEESKIKKIFLVLIFIFFALIVLFITIFNVVTDENRNIDFIISQKNDMAVRGDIFTADNFKLATSKKIYKASIDTRYLDKNKLELFCKLFNIYSGIEYEKIYNKILEKNSKNPGFLVLSYNIDSRTANNLEQLSKTLLKLQVFEYKKVNGRNNVVGLSVSISGEKREYQYEDILTPVIGYVRKYENKNSKTRVSGVKGIEKEFDENLNDLENGIMKGTQDVITYINLDKTSILKKRKDGNNIKLTIPIKLQKNIEIILDKYKEKLNADEIIVSVMESKTGKILSLASSNRFNPENILQNQIPNLNVKAIEFPFEPGSVIKPISISLAIDKNKVKEDELFFAHNDGIKNYQGEYPKGKYQIDKFTIKDDHRFDKKYLTLKDIVINSSNIGTLKIANRLSGKELLNGLHNFGFGLKTNIELPYERVGLIPSLNKLSAGESQNKDNVYKATVSYGQGMTSTFMQVMKAYTVFNNNGQIVTPYLTGNNSLKNSSKQIISVKTSNLMKKLFLTSSNGSPKFNLNNILNF